MPSLFSRARTTSSSHKNNKAHSENSDEFGRVLSRGSARAAATTAGKKSKDADKTRTRTLSTPKGKSAGLVPAPAEEPLIPDGSFFPLNLDPPTPGTSDPDRGPREREQDYGYLSYQRHVVLGLDEVAPRYPRPTTPFLFSSLALDVKSSGVRRLVQAFLRTCVPFAAPDADRTWREEARFAAPPELAMCLRWGLARVLRVSAGNAVRGLISWDRYIEWSEAEVDARGSTPPTTPFDHHQCASLLARLTAHSASSGHTPPTLSPLFGPLLFGLGPAALAFHHTYVHYLRATNAMEHILLAFVRWQDAPSNESSGSFGGGPGSAASLGKQERLQPRRGARTVRVVAVRRNVRMYSPDLVRSAAGWAAHVPGASGAFARSRDWERVAPPTLKLPPRYADGFKKRMDLPPRSTRRPGPAARHRHRATRRTTLAWKRARPSRARSWGEFEASGFGGLEPSEKKLQFDLTESARTARAAKRATLTWTDFSTTGFSRSDAPLNATLQFSTPLAHSIDAWPAQRAELARKLKKAHSALPPFGWDTEPVVGNEEVVEEAFVDVFCDLVYGGGWMDVEREEEVDRECNWALVEFKALPLAKTTASGGADPRTSTTLFLFEEFVPFEYRQQLSAGAPKRSLASFFLTPARARQWKQAPTLNGRPYVVGHVPKSPNVREVELEGIIRGDHSATRVISFGRDGTVKRDVAPPAPVLPPPLPRLNLSPTPPPPPPPPPAISAPLFVPAPPAPPARPPSPSTPTPSARRRFRLPLSPHPHPRTSGLSPSEAEDLDFETRLASYSDEERGRSRDDAWDAVRRPGGPRARGGAGGKAQDPEAASLEVAQVLAGVEASMRLDDDDDAAEPHEHEHGHGHEADTSLGSIEPMAVPHRSRLDGAVPYAPSVPDTEEEQEQEDEEEEDEEGQEERAPRRLGYFDLHPERRPAPVPSPSPEPAQLAYDDPLPTPRASDATAESAYSDDEPEPIPTPTPAPAPEPELDARAKEVRERLAGTAGPRTGALIEMYRERERAAAAAAAVAPAAVAIAAPKRVVVPEVVVVPGEPGMPGEEVLGVPVPGMPGVVDTGRESPYRYVHGAPLHNVVEEEEEE
ncbi:hypothetical protein BC834DRAFT_924457 [Gloeopeniophorella convolvens]|nr:hypothetical protein BC834DRAFT_924457 [Gloeopeniophorella convolvens]